jgi:hypothetical protein
MRLCSEANIRIIANNNASLSRVKPLTDGHDVGIRRFAEI